MLNANTFNDMQTSKFEFYEYLFEYYTYILKLSIFVFDLKVHQFVKLILKVSIASMCVWMGVVVWFKLHIGINRIKPPALHNILTELYIVSLPHRSEMIATL